MPNAQRRSARTTALWFIAASASLLLLLHFYQSNPSGLWAKIFFESLHVPVFGAVGLSLFVVTGLHDGWGPAHRVIAAGVAAMVLAVLSEAAQYPGPRDASLEDLASDLAGAGSALLFALAFTGRDDFRLKARIGFVLAGIAICLIALWPFISVSAAYIERNSQKPVIVTFDAHLDETFWNARHSTLHQRHDQATGKQIAIITLVGGPWPGLVFSDLWPDWRGFSDLVIEFGLEGNIPLEIFVEVHDRAHRQGDQPYDDRFNLTYELQPGRQTLRIPVEQIHNAPKGRQMDMSEVEGIAIFCSADHSGRQFQLVEIRLE